MTVYGKIENGRFIDAPCGSSENLITQGYKPFDMDLHARLKTFPQQVIIMDDELVDITDTDDYKIKYKAYQNELKKNELQSQIDELDKKRVRAICEPSVKDKKTGQTWLEYYNQEITKLRTQSQELG